MVNIADVVLLLRVSVGLDVLDEDTAARADIAPGQDVAGLWQSNADCVVNISDVILALRVSVGLVVLAP